MQGRHRRETANKEKKYASEPELLREPEGKKQNEGKQTLYSDCLSPYIRHLFRHKHFHYVGNIKRRLEA